MARIIRVAVEADAAAVAAIYAPFVETSHTSFELIAPPPQEMWTRIAAILETHPWLILELDGEVLGYAYASVHRSRAAYQWSTEVSVYVKSGVRRSGVGRSLYRALFAVLVEQGFYNAYAGIALPNDASVALHEALGFYPVGVYDEIGFKNGVWHSVGWWQLMLRSRELPG